MELKEDEEYLIDGGLKQVWLSVFRHKNIGCRSCHFNSEQEQGRGVLAYRKG